MKKLQQLLFILLSVTVYMAQAQSMEKYQVRYKIIAEEKGKTELISSGTQKVVLNKKETIKELITKTPYPINYRCGEPTDKTEILGLFNASRINTYHIEYMVKQTPNGYMGNTWIHVSQKVFNQYCDEKYRLITKDNPNLAKSEMLPSKQEVNININEDVVLAEWIDFYHQDKKLKLIINISP